MMLLIMRDANIVEHFFAYYRGYACGRGEVVLLMRVDMFAAAQGI